MKKFVYGFTLAETMIVIIVLGIIATLTIPALVNKNKESVAKTKVRKAMAAYESALNKMIIENDLKSDDTLTAWAGNAGNGCANSTNYFKKVQGDGCIFKTSDGIWWNITDIERPVISFKEINADNEEQITTNANNSNDKTAFVLVGRFGTDGSLRVDDLAYETANSIADANGNQSKTQVEKLYTLLGMKKAGSNTTQSPFAKCNHADTCTITYNCPTTEEPNKTCTMEYTKVTIEAAFGEYDGFTLSSSEAGDIWIADITVLYNITDAKLDENCSESRDELFCKEYGDYWTLAKRHCEAQKAHLATTAELTSLYNAGKLENESYYFASDIMDYDTSGAYIFNTYYPGKVSDESIKASDRAICVGN